MKRLSIAAACCALLAGCVTSSGIVPDGTDAYRITSTGDTGFSSSGSMKAKSYRQATEFCAKKGLVVETIATDTKQARPLGGFPESDLRFRCVQRASGAGMP